VTALTLHADAAHLAGNAGFGFLFGAACAALYGAGLAWLLIVLTAACANLAEAAWMPPGMTSLGASTAVFAALGLVTARGRGAEHGRGLARGLYGALAAGLMLLALLGTGDAHTDVLGHALGFVFGLAAGLTLRRRRVLFPAANSVLSLLTLCIVALCWSLALSSGD
jgi:membrane associated rhomboid family serine protease